MTMVLSHLSLINCDLVEDFKGYIYIYMCIFMNDDGNKFIMNCITSFYMTHVKEIEEKLNEKERYTFTSGLHAS